MNFDGSAYRAGSASWWENKEEWENPFKSGTLEHVDWERGRKYERKMDLEMLWGVDNANSM